ncbi:hypothetical protein LTR62_008304 [Meristemomyces frigidus]|uniref:GAF domain-containing protein n=1 Tax=Meristemomyces frigidus TaxID=1508187 RepID=A0AAN7YH79_9PEZI|nr:hypothetical protein LTR62_008304 [Meristemomyces frigidus]
MSPTTNSKTRHVVYTKERKSYENRRAREFYSYYHSVLSHCETEPKLCDLHDAESAATHQAIPSADKTLTAFLQLAAIRLETRRAMLFFFDSDHAYVIAEATRSISLHDSSKDENDDSLWLGFAKIPRGFSVCEVTADLPANEGSNAQDPETKAIVHVVNNLTEDTRFCGLPYVLNGPRARFYAGVPITTPNGINIGALCVLDDKPRDGLESSHVAFLRELAGTVMEHLHMVRVMTDYRRNHDMATALGTFVNGQLSAKDRELQHELAPQNGLPRQEPITPPTSDLGSEAEDQASESSSIHRLNGSGVYDVAKYPKPEDDLASQVRNLASKAANLVKGALSVDGVVFLDANDSTMTSNHHERTRSAPKPGETDTASRPTVVKDIQLETRYAELLGSACTNDTTLDHVSRTAILHPRVPFYMLSDLLRQYPKGHIWHFEAQGDDTTGPGDSIKDLEIKPQPAPQVTDSQNIAHCFPGVRSMIFLPIWNPSHDRWFGAAFLLSWSPLRVFSARSELSYLSAFCDVLLAEVARVEAQLADRSKHDFMRRCTTYLATRGPMGYRGSGR